MNRTKIEWVRNPDGTQGFTWNPITGCLNGCEYCYARKLANGRLKSRYLDNNNLAPTQNNTVPNMHLASEQIDPFYPRFWPSRLGDFGQPNGYGYQEVRKPKGIFVCDMGELFGDWIPRNWQDVIFNYIKDYPEHRFYLLTKQPQNLSKFSPFPDNCWVGGTVTSNGSMTILMTRIANIKAGKRFISFEPLLGSIGMNDHMSMKGIIDWVIIGAQTNPYKPPKIEWVEEIVEASDKAGIPVFCKDNLEKMCFNLTKSQLDKYDFWENSYTIDEFIVGVELRQEMPK